MTDSNPADSKGRSRRLSPTLAAYTAHRLNLWAFVEEVESAATQMALTTKARVDANEDNIDRKLRWYAKRYGLSFEELDQRIEQGIAQGLRLPAIHKQLEKDAIARGVTISDAEEIET